MADPQYCLVHVNPSTGEIVAGRRITPVEAAAVKAALENGGEWPERVQTTINQGAGVVDVVYCPCVGYRVLSS